jgi:hypothetical protein
MQINGFFSLPNLIFDQTVLVFKPCDAHYFGSASRCRQNNFVGVWDGD